MTPTRKEQIEALKSTISFLKDLEESLPMGGVNPAIPELRSLLSDLQGEPTGEPLSREEWGKYLDSEDGRKYKQWFFSEEIDREQDDNWKVFWDHYMDYKHKVREDRPERNWLLISKDSKPSGEQGEGWTSVKERLPEMHTLSFVCDSEGMRTTAFLQDGTDATGQKIVYWMTTYSSEEVIDNVTHWRPLPAPPGSVEGGDKE